MATEATKKKKLTIILSICAIIAIATAVIVTVVLLRNNNDAKIGDDYFISDDTKLVYTLNEDIFDENDISEYTQSKTHFVYSYEGDSITDVKIYYEYPDAAKAKNAYDYILEGNPEEEQDSVQLNGKYVIFSTAEEDYKNLSKSALEEQIETLKAIDALENSGESTVIEETDIDY